MLPTRGKSLPTGSGRDGHPRRYAEVVSLALKSELDDTRRTIKTVQRWTGASERTVKNWLSANVGPNGDHLIAMLVHSDIMLQMILIASRRLDLVEFLMERNAARALGRNRESRKDGSHNNNSRFSFHLHVPDRVPVYDPESDPDDDFVPNDRQTWFLAELASGRRVSARSLSEHFGVAVKTAKRDVAGLKANNLVAFFGTRRSGRYRLT